MEEFGRLGVEQRTSRVVPVSPVRVPPRREEKPGNPLFLGERSEDTHFSWGLKKKVSECGRSPMGPGGLL